MSSTRRLLVVAWLALGELGGPGFPGAASASPHGFDNVRYPAPVTAARKALPE